MAFAPHRLISERAIHSSDGEAYCYFATFGMGAREKRILAIDDDRSFLDTLKISLEPRYHVETANCGNEGLSRIQIEPYDVVLLDIVLPDAHGLDLLQQIRRTNPEIEVVMLSAIREVKTAVEALKLGAFHYLTKDFQLEELLILLDKIWEKDRRERELAALRSEVELYSKKTMIMGSGRACSEILQIVEQVAPLPSTVLLQGESGTGKELLARAIHEKSDRCDEPFVPVNIASLPATLVESELFGHERGAFTGATQRRVGKLQIADGGTLFLDEVSETPKDIQVKLLRFLQEGEIQRVGGNQSIQTDVRIISATNRDLAQQVAEGNLRKDLYYRLNVIPINLPPLRRRLCDIPKLAELFVARYARRFGKDVRISANALDALKHYPWPGNIRELEHLIERLVATAKNSVIDAADLPLEYCLSATEGADKISTDPDTIEWDGYLKSSLALFERNLIAKCLTQNDGNRTRTAQKLGLPLSTLKFKMQKLGLYDAQN